MHPWMKENAHNMYTAKRARQDIDLDKALFVWSNFCQENEFRFFDKN